MFVLKQDKEVEVEVEVEAEKEIKIILIISIKIEEAIIEIKIRILTIIIDTEITNMIPDGAIITKIIIIKINIIIKEIEVLLV
jgi:hypothetical protein